MDNFLSGINHERSRLSVLFDDVRRAVRYVQRFLDEDRENVLRLISRRNRHKFGRNIQITRLNEHELLEVLETCNQIVSEQPRWERLEKDLKPGMVVPGKIILVTRRYVHIEIEPGIYGTVFSRHSFWENAKTISKHQHSVGDFIESKIVSVDIKARLISLSLRDLYRDPWHGLTERYSVGQVVDGTVSKIIRFGVFINVEPFLDFLIHKDFLQNDVKYHLGDKITAKIISIDAEKRRVRSIPYTNPA